MKRFLILFALAACAPSPPVFRPVDVDVPVAMPCRVAVVAVPDFAAAHVAPADDVFDKMRACLVERAQRIAYEQALISSISFCQ